MKYASVLLAVGCLVTAAAQEWQFELVDTSCRPTDVFVKRDSARTYVAYVTGDGSICIATKDTSWHYETLDTSLVRPDAGFHFALGPAGRMAVSGVDDSFRPVVVEKSDSGWSRIWTHEQVGVSPLARAVYGVDSVPFVLYCVNNFWSADAFVETRQDSVWQVDTIEHFDPPSNYDCQLFLYDADCSADAGPCYLATWSYSFPLGKVPPSNYVLKGYRTAGGWTDVGLGGGYQASVAAYDIVAGGADTASAAVYSGGCTMFDHDTVCAGRVTDAAVQVDSLGRDQVAYVISDGSLRFAYRDTRWHYREVPGVTTAKCCDLALDEYGQPLIAYEGSTGLSLAHGIDMLGVEESHKPQASGRKLAATVIRSLLPGAVAFDAMGRRVVNPRSGILFVRAEGRGAGSAGWIRKVVLQR